MTLMTASQTDMIKVPRWVPPDLHDGYRKVFGVLGEDDAATWARGKKNGDESAPSLDKTPVAADPPRSRVGKPDSPSWWTDKRIEVLRTLAAANHSACAIAAELGATRNKIVGKAHRLGIKFRAKTKSGEAQGASVRKPVASAKVMPEKAVAAERLHASFAPVAARRAKAVQEAPIKGIGLEQLRNSSCRWPYGSPGGDEPMLYCGGAVPVATRSVGLCYCAVHLKLAYQPRAPAPRRRLVKRAVGARG